MQETEFDEHDRVILDHLRKNAREPAPAIAKELGLSSSAVRRRIARLHRVGVIEGYVVAINHDKFGYTLQAYVELSFTVEADPHAVLEKAMEQPEVREAVTLAGEPDALVRIRVRDTAHLREAVMHLRRIREVTATNTRVILGSRWHGSRALPGSPPGPDGG